MSPSASSQGVPLPGYERRVRGEVLKYHSPLPDVGRSLLVRSLESDRAIEWETAVVPAELAAETVRFVWMFGIHCGSDGHEYQLCVDGDPWFTFRNPASTEQRDWTVPGPDGASLRFRATQVDRFDDLMGFAILTLPRSSVTPGRPVRLSVVGESAGSSSWYMTFQATLQEAARLVAVPAVRRSEGGPIQVLHLDLIHLGPPAAARVTASFGVDRVVDLELGGNRIPLEHAQVHEAVPVTVDVAVDGKPRHHLEGEVRPVRPWSIDLVQHTHTDVGYTRPQTEILPEHLRFLDTALDYCDQTDDLPEDARFRWTAEASWAVREYLECRTPEQIARLRRRVLEGRIELTGMFLNMSEVVDEASYAAFLRPVRAIREAGFPLQTAMQNDINGASWCLADYAGDLGIRYLTMGQHGHRALVPFDVPTAFWWESPAGNRLLAWRADHYQTGNFWGVHTGKVENVEEGLLAWLQGLEEGGYPFERVAVQHSGYPTDNSPPSSFSSELVRDWNEQYVWPQLRCALAGDLPRWVEEHHADDIPVVRAAWPDWWTDGFGSAPRESQAARETQAHMVAVEGLLAMERVLGLTVPTALLEECEDVRDDLLFYGEHTFGAAESVREPFAENTQVQWAEKASYAWDAVKRSALLGEGALGRLAACIEPAERPQLVVANVLNFDRGGLLELYADHQVLPVDRSFRLVDQAGNALAVQWLRSRPEGSYWAIAVNPVPSFGLRRWSVEIAEGGGAAGRAAPKPGRVLENRWYRLEVDALTGAVQSLWDKELDRELVDASADWQLGQLVHETLGNREQLEAFVLEDYSRRSLQDVVVEGVVPGPVWDSLLVRGEVPGCEGPGGVRLELRLFHREKRLEWQFTAHKRRQFDPESLYVAFPFAMPDGRVVYETLGGVVAPEGGILPGAASDWQAMQSFAAVQSPDCQVVLTSPGIPLVQLGAIHTGHYHQEARVEKPHVFSWVMNNYWTTNFHAAPEGEFRWSYALTSGGESSHAVASRFGHGSRVPLLGRLLPARVPGAADPAQAGSLPRAEDGSLLDLDVANLLLVSARPATHGDGIVLHLREVLGSPARLELGGLATGGTPYQVWRVNAAEERLARLRGNLDFDPFEPCFLLLEQD